MNEPNNMTNNISNTDNGVIEPIPGMLLHDEQLASAAVSMDMGIEPGMLGDAKTIFVSSRFSNMSTEDLNDILNFGRSRITEAEALEIEAILNSRKREDEVDTLGRGNSQAKTYTKALPQFKNSRADDAGYINIIILMLTVWATCLCGMFYVYSQLSIMG